MDRSAVGPRESAQDKAPLPGKPSRIGHGGPRRGVLGSRVTEGPQNRDAQRRGDRTNTGHTARRPGPLWAAQTQPLQPRISLFQTKKPRSEMLSN